MLEVEKVGVKKGTLYDPTGEDLDRARDLESRHVPLVALGWVYATVSLSLRGESVGIRSIPSTADLPLGVKYLRLHSPPPLTPLCGVPGSLYGPLTPRRLHLWVPDSLRGSANHSPETWVRQRKSSRTYTDSLLLSPLDTEGEVE